MNKKINFSNNLKILIKAAGYTQAEFAEYIGIGLTTLGYYLHGDVAPTMQRLCAISEALHVSIDELVYSNNINEGFYENRKLY